MPLKLLPLELTDFDTLIGHASLHEPGDDLVAPPNPIAWPVSTRAEAQLRARHCFALQRRRFLGDASVNFLKVVAVNDDGLGEDAHADGSGDIVAVARWHFYAQGYEYKAEAGWEMAEALPTGDGNEDEDHPPSNFNIALHDHILTARDSFRPQWIPAGKPCWILMHLVTRPSQRRRGAAGLLIRWGMQRARDMGVAAYLEAGVQGRPVYEKFGWRQVGEVRTVALTGVGGWDGVGEFALSNMRWNAKGEAGEVPDGQEEEGKLAGVV
ncbi:hypothetical protein BJ170DRAFT_606083 [Xylariales sp. AK1849]|nr:hypothetical protein BJ170DRAFT_606083 [Xylariales sp. AK1849]